MSEKELEVLLQTLSPDVYALLQLGKSEAHLWDLLNAVQGMRRDDVTGRIEVFYTRGHIDTIKQTVDMLAYKASRPGY